MAGQSGAVSFPASSEMRYLMWPLEIFNGGGYAV